MPLVIAPDVIASVSAQFTVANLAADGVIEWQLSRRPDFKFCVCPVRESPRASPINLVSLNQDATYYVRARTKRANGDLEDWSEAIGIRTTLNQAPNTAPTSVMIQPALIVVPTPVVAWSAGNEVAGFPVKNLGYDAPVAWRSKPAGALHELQARIAPEPVDTIALLMTNCVEAGSITIKAGNAAMAFGGGNGAVSFGPFPFRASANISGRDGYHALIQLPQAYKYPFWKVEYTHPWAGELVHMEHAIFGLNRKSKNHSLDKVETPLDLGSLERSRSGNPQRVRGLRMRRVDFDISVLTEAQYETLYADLGRLVGSTDPVLVAPNSKGGAFLHDRLLYGAITGGRISNPASPRYTRSFTIDSLI